MTAVDVRTRCIAWRNNYGQSWRGEGAYRCGNNARPDSQFCTHHKHLVDHVESISWKEQS